MNLRQGLINDGWIALQSRRSKRAYVDAGGTRYGTLERDGVRIALSLGRELFEERGTVMVYTHDNPTDAILMALIVDPDKRCKGLAKAALQRVIYWADHTQTSIDLEPCPIEDKPVGQDVLIRMYEGAGFVKKVGCKVVMNRPAVTSI